MTGRIHLFLALIIGLYVALGAAFAVRTPRWQAPDEPAHFNYIRHLAEGRGLPVLQPGDYDQAYLSRLVSARFPDNLSIDGFRYEAHQPPLYYALGALLYRVLESYSLDQQVAALRLVSVFLGALLLLVAYGTARRIFPENPVVALAVPAFIAALPQHLATGSAINNDTLAELLLSLLLLALLSSAPTVVVGLLLGLALLTKTNVYVALLLVPLGLWMAGGKRGKGEEGKREDGEAGEALEAGKPGSEEVGKLTAADEMVEPGRPYPPAPFPAQEGGAVAPLRSGEGWGEGSVSRLSPSANRTRSQANGRASRLPVFLTSLLPSFLTSHFPIPPFPLFPSDSSEGANPTPGSLAARLRFPPAFVDRLAAIHAVALVVSGWWFVRNALVYGGLDVFGWQRHAQLAVGELRTVLGWEAARYFVETSFRSFWVQIGWMSVPASDRTYWFLGALTVLSALGLGVFAVRILLQRAALSSGQRRSLLLLAAALALVFATMAQYNLRYVQPQGRYLFYAIVPMALFFALGLQELGRHRILRPLLALLVAGMGLFALLEIRDLVPLQADPLLFAALASGIGAVAVMSVRETLWPRLHAPAGALALITVYLSLIVLDVVVLLKLVPLLAR